MPREQVVAMPFRQIHRGKIGAAWMPGAAIIGHDGRILNIDMRRNAFHPKGTSFGARLLTPYDNPRYTLRADFSWCGRAMSGIRIIDVHAVRRTTRRYGS